MALTLMSQAELVEALADRTGWTKSDVKHVLAELDEVIAENLGACVRTKISGVTIYPHLAPKRKARMGRNPATGDPVKIAAKAASSTVKAKVDSKLKAKAPTVRKLQNAL
jgi:nucleoid DNA-binding protein